MRWQQKPFFVRMFANPEIDYLLAVLRLQHELPNEDSPVAIWVMSKTQLMMAAASDRESRDIGVQIAGKLVEWGNGRVSDAWFLQELKFRPVEADFRVPRARKMRRYLSRSKEGLSVGAVIGGIVLAVRGMSAALK
ncbi:hypothetical protein KIV56_04560 [Cryobacterium breve]|uniref:Uncharacterized protein n=1 Tax=Cryobacterium breve TaxID=1259258 RepID=A0ABY7NGH6_9MICO|nr:hypothetical protein [Cryobacterium breve]WBM80675.1 hypothetical protein KIV56_04560 [Cryobacterium breve]